MKHLKKFISLLLLSGLISLNCDLLEWDGDPEPVPNVLKKKDSLAIRAILDQNGLQTTKVTDAINLQNSRVGTITLDSLQLTRLILTRTINSLGPGFRINVFNCPVDTLIIVDTISIDLVIAMNSTNIKSIPTNITILKGSLAFYLSRNKINHLPDEIMKCNVSYINLDYNNLCSVSDTLNNWIIKNSRNAYWKSKQICN